MVFEKLPQIQLLSMIVAIEYWLSCLLHCISRLWSIIQSLHTHPHPHTRPHTHTHPHTQTPFMAPQDVSLIDSTHKLTSLTPSQLHTITRLMSTLKALITQQLHCDSHDCLAGILTEVFQRLAGLFLQLEERNGLEFNTIVATVLVEHCLMHWYYIIIILCFHSAWQSITFFVQ